MICGNRSRVVRVLLSTYDSRGGVEPLVALALELRRAGVEAVLVAPPDNAERLAEVGVPLVPVPRTVRSLAHGERRPTPADVPRIAAELHDAQFDVLAGAAEQGCDAIVATGLPSVVAAAQSVAEMLGVHSVRAGFWPAALPSPRYRPFPLPGRPLPEGVTDNEALWRHNAESYNVLFGEAINARRVAVGLPPVDDVRALVLGNRTWLAADPVLAPWEGPGYVDVVQTGAWITPDERPLPAGLEAFLDAGEPPVYAGFGSLPAPADFARVAVEAARAHGRRIIVGRGWADLAPADAADCFAVGEVNQQALFRRMAAVVHHGGAGTTTTATRSGAPQVVVPQIADQPYWAARVVDLGVGVAHDGPTPTVESLSTALEAALSVEIRKRATAVAPTIRTDGTAIAVRLLREAILEAAA
jgi:vancomycin aglycone glucosyltransferase